MKFGAIQACGPAIYIERRNLRVERRLYAASGMRRRVLWGQFRWSVEVERGAEDADGEVGQVGGVFIKLNPSNDAVIFHVLGDLRLVDS